MKYTIVYYSKIIDKDEKIKPNMHVRLIIFKLKLELQCKQYEFNLQYQKLGTKFVKYQII